MFIIWLSRSNKKRKKKRNKFIAVNIVNYIQKRYMNTYKTKSFVTFLTYIKKPF